MDPICDHLGACDNEGKCHCDGKLCVRIDCKRDFDCKDALSNKWGCVWDDHDRGYCKLKTAIQAHRPPKRLRRG